MDEITHTVTMPLPAGYEGSFRVPGEATPAPRKPVEAASTPTASTITAPDMAAAAVTMVAAAKRVDYLPIGVGELATVLMLGLVWRHLKGAPDRMRAIAAGEAAPRASWLPDDDHAERIAFEARYGRGSLR